MDYKTFCINSANHFKELARKNFAYSKLESTPNKLSEQAIKDAHKCLAEAKYYAAISEKE